jgi:uncharacterized OB-fold protein
MKSEKGQALPLAIIVLALGALLIAPFLGHASTSLIGSNDYAQVINYRNACDAGVEHAIWRLAYGNLGASIPTVGSNITYQLPEAINGIIPSITVTTNSTAPDEPTGIITGQIDTYEYDTSNCYEPEIRLVSGNVFVTAYRGPSNRGYLKTYSIAANGTITHSVISTYTFDSTACYTPDIIHVSGTVWAIAYRYTSGSTNRGYLKTVNIANNGTITQSVISTLTFESSGGYEPSIVQVSGVYYAIAYRGSSNKGTLKTVSISATGVIGSSVISTLTFDSTAGYEPKIIQTSGSIFAILYINSSNYLMLKTVNIASNGVIGSSIISSVVADPDYDQCSWPDIIKISDTVFACIYTATADYPDLATVHIAADGTISRTVIDLAEYDYLLYTPRIIHISGNIYMICGRGNNNRGAVSTVNIKDDGTITNWTISSYTFNSSYGYEPSIIQVSTDVVAVVYRGPSDDGWVVTIGTAELMAGDTFTIVASAGTIKIRAYVRIVDSTTSIITWVLQ